MAEEEVLEVSEEENEEEKNNKFMAWIEGHPKTVFWIRFVLWTLCACVLPFLFIVWRFELFRTVSKFQIGGWGIIAVFIVGIFAIVLVKYIRLALNSKYTMTGQILNGICKVILPLVILLAILICVRDSVETTIKVLGVVTFLELVAIPLNPLPKWVYEKQKDVKDSEKKETVDYLLDSFFKRKQKNDESGD